MAPGAGVGAGVLFVERFLSVRWEKPCTAPNRLFCVAPPASGGGGGVLPVDTVCAWLWLWFVPANGCSSAGCGGVCSDGLSPTRNGFAPTSALKLLSVGLIFIIARLRDFRYWGLTTPYLRKSREDKEYMRSRPLFFIYTARCLLRASKIGAAGHSYIATDSGRVGGKNLC